MHWFPDDEIGDTLRRMAERGANLDAEYEIQFESLFPDEDTARQFMEAMQGHGFERTHYLHLTEPLTFMAIVVLEIVPEHDVIARLENHFRVLAPEFLGEFDGWSCFVG